MLAQQIGDKYIPQFNDFQCEHRVMRTSLHFRYVGADPDRESEVPLVDLGRSLLGFDRVIKDLTRIIRLNGEIDVRAVATSEGSLIIDALLELNLELGQLPFERIDDLLAFLQMVSEHAWKNAIQFFNEIQYGLNELNDYFAKRPFNLAMFALLIPVLIRWIRKSKDRIPIEDEELAARIAKELQAIVKKGVFGDALSPIIEDSASAIEISADRKFGPAAARIDSANLGDYLSPESQILPDLHNGEEYTFQGKITSLKATRGESLTFHYLDAGKCTIWTLSPSAGDLRKTTCSSTRRKCNSKQRWNGIPISKNQSFTFATWLWCNPGSVNRPTYRTGDFCSLGVRSPTGRTS